MKSNMRNVFEEHARRWLDAWTASVGQTHGITPCAPETLMEKLARLPSHVRVRLGMALHRGRLVADTAPGRGFYVGPPSSAYKSYMLTRRGDEILPCWEMFVHLAEFAGLDAMRSAYEGLEVKIEDELMDLTVRVDGKLIAYIEVKRDQATAKRLVEQLSGLHGHPIGALRKTDAEKKLGYLLKNATPEQPVAFSVRAGDSTTDSIFETTWRAIVRDGAVWLEDTDDPVPLSVELDQQQDPRVRALACLVWHLERNAPVMIERGRHGTYVVYRDCGPETPVVVGTERRGSIVTVLAALEPDRLPRFEACLRKHGLTLGPDPSGQHRIWKTLDGAAALIEDESLARSLGRDLAAVLRD